MQLEFDIQHQLVSDLAKKHYTVYVPVSSIPELWWAS